MARSVYQRKDRKTGKPLPGWYATDPITKKTTVKKLKKDAVKLQNRFNSAKDLREDAPALYRANAKAAALEERASEPIVLTIRAYYQQHCTHLKDSETPFNQLVTLTGAMGAKTVEDLSLDALNDALVALMKGVKGKRKISKTTRNKYSALAKKFGEWLHATGRLDSSPFRHVQHLTVRDQDLERPRMALSMEQVQTMMRTFPEYATLYLFATTTGFRANETRMITWQMMHLDEDYMVVPGKWTKNGKNEDLPLLPEVAAMLREKRGLQLRGLVFPEMPKNDHSAAKKLVREHAAACGFEVDGPDGQQVDWHSLRTTASTTFFDSGMSTMDVKDLMRHASIATTDAHYRKRPNRDKLREALAKINLKKHG